MTGKAAGGKRGGRILALPGDGIGPEVMAEAVKLLSAVNDAGERNYDVAYGLVGGASIDACGTPLAASCLAEAGKADAVLLGAVGGPDWDSLATAQRPERGLLALRRGLGLYANLRPATVFPPLVDASTLKRDVIDGLDLLIVRELTGGIYFGEPRGIRTSARGERYGVNTLTYTSGEIRRVATLAFELAGARKGRLCSVDKANVLEATALWREEVKALSASYPKVELSHMYVDNAAMQLVRDPRQFDVLVTTNMFGDILSDAAAMLTGSLGMLPSASLGEASAGGCTRKGMYEPVHGSAPDIAGTGAANPLAMLLSVAMMLRWSFADFEAAAAVEASVGRVLEGGARCADLMTAADRGRAPVSTSDMGERVAREAARILSS